MAKQILVINPNSSDSVTRDIDVALAPLRTPEGTPVVCRTLSDGPPAIESQEDVDDAAGRVCRYIQEQGQEAGAFVIACFSDPGLLEARALGRAPVFGIGECGILASMALGDRVGVISILASSRDRHVRQYRRMGVESRIAGERSVETGVAGLGDEEETMRRLTGAGHFLRDTAGADVLVLACAGMARYRTRLQDSTGIPVVDPAQAATGFALDVVKIGCSG